MRRSQLYVPANSERMMQKSLQLEADSVIFDLEDSVPPAEKSNARKILKQFLSTVSGVRKELCVRTSPLNSDEFANDIELARGIGTITTLVIPKANFEPTLESLHRTTGKQLIPLIETPQGLLAIREIAGIEGVVGISYGAGDLALAMRGSIDALEKNLYIKTIVAVAARAGGLDPIDKVFFDLKDEQGFREDAVQAKDLGFSGKQVIHPSQIQIANEIFSPTQEELAWARTVVEAYDRAATGGIGAIRVNGQLIDHVHYLIAKNLLDQA